MLLKLLEDASNAFDDSTVRPLAGIIGFPEEQVRLFVMWFIQIPVGWFLHFYCRGSLIRHWVNTLLGFIGMTYFFGWAVLHVIFMSSVTWMLMAYAPRNQQHKYVCAFLFAVLSSHHLDSYLNYYGSYEFHISTQTMLLTLRLQALSFSYYDGGQE